MVQIKELPKYERCGSCDCYHSVDYFGDCRDNNHRFNMDELDEKHGDLGWEEVDSNRFTNYYECSCGCRWEDNWSCMCNDRCPDCDTEIEPYESVEN